MTRIINLILLASVLLTHFTDATHCFAEDIEYIDKEIIRNGGFEEKLYTGWFANIFSTTKAAKEGERGMESYEYSQERDDYFFQNLALPSRLSSATVSFDYRAIYNGTAQAPPSINLHVYLAKSKGFDTESIFLEMPTLTQIGTLYNDNFNQTTGWQEFTVDLDDVLVSEVQATHNAGEFVFLVFVFHSEDNTWMTTQNTGIHIDDVSFQVNGTQHVPVTKGKIAFYEYIEANTDENQEEQRTINILDPNTCKVDTVLNDSAISARKCLKWRPDGKEIAFGSIQEAIFSPCYNDIFTIKPDGSYIRKVTSQPSQEEIENGEFRHVSLSGKVKNNASSPDPSKIVGPTTLSICVRGAMEPITLTIGEMEEVAFTIPDVAVLNDSDTFEQHAIIYWSNNLCHTGLEYETLVGAVTDDKVNVSTVSFEGAACVAMPGDYYMHDITWKKDGSEIDVSVLAMGGLLKFDATSGLPFFGEPMNSHGLFPRNIERSPTDDDYLYIAEISGDLYLAQEGEEPELLVENVEDVSPAWLLDGSGFIFVRNGVTISDNIYFFSLETKEIQQLSCLGYEEIDGLSVSPDNRYIVFNRCASSSDNHRFNELWIMDRLNPAEMWQVTEGGTHFNPDWSRVDVAVTPDDDDNNDNNDGSNNNNGGGGGGGCFTLASQHP